MKTIDLSSNLMSVDELLDTALEDLVLVKTEKGDSFVVSTTDEFNTEVELLRRNHAFLMMLDDFKSENETIPLDQVESELR